MRQHFPDLVCAYRAIHPTRRCYTFFGNGVSRIDRIYVSSALMSHVEQCTVHTGMISDHRPVILHLRPAAPPEVGPGLRRTRVYFLKYPHLKAEFLAWLVPQLDEHRGMDAAQLLAWWPVFKRAVAFKAAALNKAAVTMRRNSSADCATAKSALRTAMQQVEHSATPATLAAATAARQTYVTALKHDASANVLAARHDWVHTGERPCPLLTKLTRPPQASRLVPCLRAPGGGLVVGGELPTFVAKFFEAIFTSPPSDSSAQEQVLAAVRACKVEISSADAGVMGSSDVTVDDCLAALKSSASGRSPGPDGIPFELYRAFKDDIMPVFAQVLSAVGRTGQTPAGFTDGVLIVLFKKGDTADAANYRPITLLNTDYRLLAKVLASRAAAVLSGVISPEQSAFLPGRIIGDNIMLLQLLPACLRAEGRSAVVAFLDFVKAYDTVNREFLFAVMRTMGAGDGFLKWVRTLLSHTQFVALVNGFASAPAVSAEGVRQGCPLAPLLYLFVAQALQCFLHVTATTASSGIGIQLAGALRCSSQYADDTQVLLRSLDPACVESFVSTMHVFGLASGQRLNLPKCELLPVGDPTALASAPNSAAASVAGIKVVAAATSLGLTYSNALPAAADQPGAAGPAEVDWPQRVAGTDKCYSKIAKLHLSTFGRAFGASGYGVSKLLYHAEYSGMPPAVAASLAVTTTKLVDRARAPTCRKRALPGVPSQLLPGHPSGGGFGCLPWREHVHSRHAVWGARLVTALAAGLDERSPIWHHLALALLSLTAGAVPGSAQQAVMPPALALLAASPANRFQPVAGAPGLPPGPLQRMAAGLRALHPEGLQPLDVVAAPLLAEPWCADAPLWGNPLLPCPAQPARGVAGGPGSVLDDGFGVLQVIPSLRTVRDLHRIRLVVDATLAICSARVAAGALRSDQARQLYLERVWEPELRRVGLPFSRLHGQLRLLVEDRGGFAVRLHELCAAVPAAWLALCAPPLDAPVTDEHRQRALSAVVDRLGWRLPTPTPAAASQPVLSASQPVLPTSQPVLLRQLVVKTGTMLQLGQAVAARRAAHEAYAAQALHLPAGSAVEPCVLSALTTSMSTAWYLKWENVEKEVFWRVAVDGVRGANSRVQFRCHCGCGEEEATEARAHAFWECPIAVAVRGTIEAALQPQSPVISRASLWLCRPPPAVYEEVWLVVCMAALSAMEHGRRQLWRLHCAAQAAGPPPAVQLTLQQAWWPAAHPVVRPPSVLARASALAVADFWARLASFAALGLAPDKWGRKVPPAHPFLSNGGCRVNMGMAGLHIPAHVSDGSAGGGSPACSAGSAGVAGVGAVSGAVALAAAAPSQVAASASAATAAAASADAAPAAAPGPGPAGARRLRQVSLRHVWTPRVPAPAAP